MKKATLFLCAVLLSCPLHANGVGVLDAKNAVYLRLDSTHVQVTVEGQIAVTTTTQYFTNLQLAGAVAYAFPMPDQASATKLRWLLHGQWKVASFSGTPQDTTLPGGGSPHPDLVTYLGKTPLYFPIPETVQKDSTVAVELTFVQLLPYSGGSVDYVYPSDYRLIQPGVIALQTFSLHLTSQRSIDSIGVLSVHEVEQMTNTGDTAVVLIALHERQGAADYHVRYTLNANELGLFAYSTAQPDTIVPDSLGHGFLTFIAEPDPSVTTATIAKVFTLIIDRSGSMWGEKIVQARDAASFIVQNLNPGDRFNLIDFDDIITSFRATHVPYTAQTRDSALAYVGALTARGLTNISGVFSTAIPQFASANDSTANIIIFFTDGQPTIGIQNTELLVHHVDSLAHSTETNINLFCFGIGSDVNVQLLTLVATQNRGLADFLGNDEVYDRITDFYLTVRNPVLLNSHISFVPPIVNEIYPDSLPNLYKGKQMIVAGRYMEAQPVQITLSGTAFGQPVSYTYTVGLEDSTITEYQFLPKVWAKRKIESLLIRYYGMNPDLPAARALKDQVIAISLAYGVISPFTSFKGDATGVEERTPAGTTHPAAFELLGNYPNPFNPSTTIRVRINADYSGPLAVRIYNALGQIVRTLQIEVHGGGVYDIVWDGHGEGGRGLSSGVYFYGIELHNTVLVGRMIMVK